MNKSKTSVRIIGIIPNSNILEPYEQPPGEIAYNIGLHWYKKRSMETYKNYTKCLDANLKDNFLEGVTESYYCSNLLPTDFFMLSKLLYEEKNTFVFCPWLTPKSIN